MRNISKISGIVMAYGLTSLIFFISGFFMTGALDIAMHDRYYVIRSTHVLSMIALLFLMFALIIWGFYKLSWPLSSILNWLHYGITISCFILLFSFSMSTNKTAKRIYDYSLLDEIEEYDSGMSINEWFTVVGIILVLSQVLFSINIIRAFLLKKKSVKGHCKNCSSHKILRMNEIKYLAENEIYKVYSIYESVYLKEKKLNDNLEGFSKKDRFIAHHYGDPNNGIITENHVIISGCGISIYDLRTGLDKYLLEEKPTWTYGIHQDSEDDFHTEFRFVTWNSKNQLRVFKMHVETGEIVELE